MKKEFIGFILTLIFGIVVIANLRTITLKAVELTTPKCDPEITISYQIDGIEVEKEFNM